LIGLIGGRSGADRREFIRFSLELEQSKLNREKSLLMLDKSLLMYFAFLVVGIIGFINHYITVRYLNLVIVLSFCVLASGLIPYMITMYREEKRLSALLSSYQNKEQKRISSGRSKSGQRKGRSKR